MNVQQNVVSTLSHRWMLSSNVLKDVQNQLIKHRGKIFKKLNSKVKTRAENFKIFDNDQIFIPGVLNYEKIILKNFP